MSSADATWGRIGLPAPISTLARQQWDVIVIGAGHNGLACAAYLARAGKRVLVLEARERIGGACTLEEPWPGYRISPCAYLAGLLHPLVIRELNLPAHGFKWTPADAGLFVPFPNGSKIQFWCDDAKCEAEIRRFAPHDLKGWRAFTDVKRRLRDALRPDDDTDIWIGPSPTRDQIATRLGEDEEALGLLFEWSMADYVDRYLIDERLKMALLGQGVIGTNASPFDPGTASIHYHHSSGRMSTTGVDGQPGVWGYVTGGMGRVSFILCDIARSHGAVVASGVPVARIYPGCGVELDSGDRINAPVIVSNADPRVTLRLLGEDVDANWKRQVESIPIEGGTLKVNVALSELPDFIAQPGLNEPHHRGQINTPLTAEQWRDGFAAARSGRLPDRLWTELYFQTAVDPSVAPPGKHIMTVFAQYVPYTFESGDWDTHRSDAGALALTSIGEYSHNLPDAVIDLEVMGPPDIESRVGLTGGHIFQGECLPAFMWDRRLSSNTPHDGVYLCGACTHPGGSVIAINGRNAAMEILNPS